MGGCLCVVCVIKVPAMCVKKCFIAKAVSNALNRFDNVGLERFELTLVGNPIIPSCRLERAKNRHNLLHKVRSAALRSIAYIRHIVSVKAVSSFANSCRVKMKLFSSLAINECISLE